MANFSSLTPAYGRDYKSRKAIVDDLNEGKDFLLNVMGGATYMSIRDIKAGDTATVRYKKLTQVTSIKFKEVDGKVVAY